MCGICGVVGIESSQTGEAIVRRDEMLPRFPKDKMPAPVPVRAF